MERNHGLDQDRLVKELRMADISTIEQAGWFLLETYPPKQKKLDGAISILRDGVPLNFIEILSQKEAVQAGVRRRLMLHFY
jgi:hypothetical protein